MDVTSLGFRTDLMILRLDGSEVTDRGTHLVVRTPANPGYWWGNFVLFPEPRGAEGGERWCEAFAAEFPGAGHMAIGVDGAGGATGDAGEWARLGVSVDVSTVLTADRLVAPRRRPPPGTVVRPLAGDDDWAQALALRLACEGSPGEPEHLRFAEAKQASYRALCESGRGAWFGAFTEGALRAGTGVFSDGSGTARFQNVETAPDFRRRGLAGAVLHEAAAFAGRALGADTLVIVADPAYHAIRLYRELGFAATQSQVQLSRQAGRAVTPAG
jgi:ribosomal protein S18 acetylase RimI-like enzyme